MKLSHLKVVAACIGVLILVAAFSRFFRTETDFETEKGKGPSASINSEPENQSTTLIQKEEAGAHSPSSGKAETSGGNASLSIEDLVAEISRTHENIRSAANSITSEHELNALRKKLQEANPATAAAAVVRFLDTMEDADTGLPFALAKGGALAQAPTLRAFLLDLLGLLDPVQAPGYSSRIFADTESSVEWALAMRNLAWTNARGVHTAELQLRFGEMLNRSEWLETPDAGFLEALDIGVYLGSRRQWNQITRLVGLETEDRGIGIEHAAMMAMDRILLNNRDMAFGELKSNPALLHQAPVQRATLAARADVTSPEERRTVESYLLRKDLSQAELKAFFELFPHRSYTAGHRLASNREPRMGLSSVAENDIATLAVVREWSANPSFVDLQPRLSQLQQKLESYAAEIRADRVSGQSGKPLAQPSPDGSSPSSEGSD